MRLNVLLSRPVDGDPIIKSENSLLCRNELFSIGNAHDYWFKYLLPCELWTNGDEKTDWLKAQWGGHLLWEYEELYVRLNSNARWGVHGSSFYLKGDEELFLYKLRWT